MKIMKAQIIQKNGRKEFAVIAYPDYLKLRERLEDYEDLRCLRQAKSVERDAPTIGLPELRQRLQRQTGRHSRLRRRRTMAGR